MVSFLPFHVWEIEHSRMCMHFSPTTTQTSGVTVGVRLPGCMALSVHHGGDEPFSSVRYPQNWNSFPWPWQVSAVPTQKMHFKSNVKNCKRLKTRMRSLTALLSISALDTPELGRTVAHDGRDLENLVGWASLFLQSLTSTTAWRAIWFQECCIQTELLQVQKFLLFAREDFLTLKHVVVIKHIANAWSLSLPFHPVLPDLCQAPHRTVRRAVRCEHFSFYVLLRTAEEKGKEGLSELTLHFPPVWHKKKKIDDFLLKPYSLSALHKTGLFQDEWQESVFYILRARRKLKLSQFRFFRDLFWPFLTKFVKFLPFPSVTTEKFPLAG